MSVQPSPSALPAKGRPRAALWAMSLMFFLSGVAALIYQIVWAKELALVFGVTLYATSAVVTTFMAGLALGSLYFGRLVDRWERPLVLFALLEAGIGAFALVFPAAVVLLRHTYVLLYGPLGEHHYLLSLVRFAMSFCVLIVPTSLMGGTLPVIMRACALSSRRIGRDVAGLYAANNIGAFVGCVAAGYFLLELSGPTGALRLAAVLNAAVMGMSLYLSRSAGPQPPITAPEPGGQRVEAAPGLRLSGPVKVALWVFGLEGVTSLVYQMAWLRMLIFWVHMDIYGVTAIVATFLMGLSLGAFVSRRWVDRLRDPYRALGIIEVMIGLAAVATVPVLPFLLGIHNSLVGLQASGLPLGIAYSAANFAVTFLIILVPTSFMGATLPVVSRIYVGELQGLGRKMGVLGCLDTVGSILGAFLGGFVLIPVLGVQRTIIATALLNLALAAWVFRADPDPEGQRTAHRRFAAAALGFALVALLLLVKPVPFITYSHVLVGKPILELVRYEEDEGASASVVEQKGFGRFLYVNDHVVAGDFRGDRASHELVLHVPLLLHPDPKRVLIIGLGIGQSVYASLVHDVQVDVVELSRAVVRVNPCFERCFEDYREEFGRSILADPDVKVRIDDGRNFVLGATEKYDVIHVGGFHPVLTSGAAGFYSVEFYRDCQRLLTPDGIFSQWLPIHQIPHEDFKTILRSFRAGFPYTSIWHKHSSDFCMLTGSLKPQVIDFTQFERRMHEPRVLQHLARSNVYEVWDLLDSFLVSGEGIDRAVGDGPLQTDKHPYIEYHKFRAMQSDTMRNLALLAAHRERVWPHLTDVPEDRREEVKAQLEKWFEATAELLMAQCLVADKRSIPIDAYQARFQEIAGHYLRALELNPDDRNAEFLWKRALAHHHLLLAGFYQDRGQIAEAEEHLRLSAAASPDTYWGAEAKFLLDAWSKGLRYRPR